MSAAKLKRPSFPVRLRRAQAAAAILGAARPANRAQRRAKR